MSLDEQKNEQTNNVGDVNLTVYISKQNAHDLMSQHVDEDLLKCNAKQISADENLLKCNAKQISAD